MGLVSWFKGVFSAPKLTSTTPVVSSKPLWEQFLRIGGGLTPDDVSRILRRADGGQPASFVDLTNESQQKDSHFQSVVSTRERAVALVDLGFIEPKDATAQEKAAVDVCRRAVEDFENWPTLIEHLTGSFRFGHATAETPWEKTKDGLLLPKRAQPIHARDFIFAQKDGALRYRTSVMDTVGVDLLADNPGRIVQLQRRITGDVPAREGLARVLVWAALLRNWSLRDWVALGEIGWKPWVLAKYKDGTAQDDIDALVRALELVGSSGIGAFPEGANLDVAWPSGTLGSGGSTHKEMFDALGREMSKGVLGTTTTVESGPHGTKGDTATRDLVRGDIRESDARAVAACLRYQFFAPIVAVNVGADVRVPVPWFQTEESADQKEFSEAVKNLQAAGLKIPAKWVRDEIGMPEPLEGEEVLEPPAPVAVQVPPNAPDGGGDGSKGGTDPANPEANPNAPPAKGAKAKALDENGLPTSGTDNGQKYTDNLTTEQMAHGAKALAPTVAAMVTEIAKAASYDEARAAVEKRYAGLASPIELKVVTEAGLILAHLGGAAAVREDTPEITS